MDIKKILQPYNPWLTEGEKGFALLPEFHRPIFDTLWDDLENIPQMLSITGPRRIGKSTLLQQIIQKLFKQGVPAKRLIYYSFDDPFLATRGTNVADLIDGLMQQAHKLGRENITYFFFDEIQRLENWELYLKKYYDLKYPFKIIISGSASSPIFKKSRESLLGRVKDYHLLPFSFREFLLFFLTLPNQIKEIKKELQVVETLRKGLSFQLGKDIKQGDELKDAYEKLDFFKWLNDPLIEKVFEVVEIEAQKHCEIGTKLRNALAMGTKTEQLSIAYNISESTAKFLTYSMNRFMEIGGFPETWKLSSDTARQEYLYDNQVKKVIYEDLVLATEFRKPELLKQFYISLLESPGREVSVTKLSSELGINARQIEKYFPLLEMTDLVYRLPKYRGSAMRVRQGQFKCYLVDLALRNAVLRLGENDLNDDAVLGLYAENLVFLALKKWKGILQLDYYREKNTEVDFIAHISPGTVLPVEVKYRNQIKSTDFKGINSFIDKRPKAGKPALSIMVTKRWEDMGPANGGKTLMIPLALFLLMFD